MRVLIALLLSFGLSLSSALATAGIAEWEIPTPGGNMISHIDPYINSYGTCIRAADTNKSFINTSANPLFVSHLKRWKYAKGVIGGECKNGFFLFIENRHQTYYFPTEKELDLRMQVYGSNSPWFTGQDGWNLGWRRMYEQHKKRLGLTDNQYWQYMLDTSQKAQEQMPYWAKMTDAEKNQSKQITKQRIAVDKKLVEEPNELEKYVPH